MIYKLKEQKNKFIDKVYKDSMKDLNKFYGIHWTNNRPSIIVVESRKQIDQIKDRKTERWVVGWSDGKFVYVLAGDKMEKESNHTYSKDGYIALIKHEISHAFYSILSKGKHEPRWLCEGVAIYTSGQNKFKKSFKKFSNFLSFYNKGGSDIYSESGFAVEILVRKYGKKKLLKLISNLGAIKDKNDFSRLFKKIYSFSPSYKEFNALLKKVK